MSTVLESEVHFVIKHGKRSQSVHTMQILMTGLPLSPVDHLL